MPIRTNFALPLLGLGGLALACGRYEPKAAVAGPTTEGRSVLAAAPGSAVTRPGAATLPPDRVRTRSTGTLEVVAEIRPQMPTGVTVSQGGRIFLNYPHWDDPIAYTVAELRGQAQVPFPNPEINRADPSRPRETLLSVQSVVVDPADRLWILDTAAVNFGPVVPGGAKLVAVDLRQDRVADTIVFGPDVALPTSYVNDVRFDLRRGAAGFAFITDCSPQGPNAIIVVDLATHRAWRALNDHPSVKPDPSFLGFSEGLPLYNGGAGQRPQPLRVGADGIAISADGSKLYYCPLASRHLYSVSVDALVRDGAPDAASTVVDLGEKGASDGLESDAEGRVYATNYEQNAVLRRDAAGLWRTLVSDPALLWPDTLSLGPDGYLYITSNQLERRPGLNGGVDLRQRPFVLYRTRVDARPVRLARPDADAGAGAR